MIELGFVYKDRISGFEGVATAKTKYLNGCISVLLTPQGLSDDGKKMKSEWIDIQRLIEDSGIAVGGPGPTPPSLPTP